VKYKKEVTMCMKYSCVKWNITKSDNIHEVQLCVVKDKKEVTTYKKYNSVYLFFMFHYTAVLHVHCHLFCMFHYRELYFMHIVTSFLYWTTQSCSSCTLSPLFYVSYSCVKWNITKSDNIHEVQLCVVKDKKEVTTYKKYNSV
jgi:hypothetical protein